MNVLNVLVGWLVGCFLLVIVIGVCVICCSGVIICLLWFMVVVKWRLKVIVSRFVCCLVRIVVLMRCW